MKITGFKRVILWAMCIAALALVIMSVLLQNQCGEGGCDAMRFGGYAVLLLFSILRSAWRSPQRQPADSSEAVSEKDGE